MDQTGETGMRGALIRGSTEKKRKAWTGRK